MQISFSEPEPVSEEDLASLRRLIGCEIPDVFLSFLQKYNGAVPEPNEFEVGKGNASGIRQFLPVQQIPKERVYVEGLNEKAFPFAYDECGNYVVFDAADGHVAFWDHELQEPLILLANSIDEFLKRLKPFDPEAVELAEGQVISAWIDPDFLKSLK